MQNNFSGKRYNIIQSVMIGFLFCLCSTLCQSQDLALDGPLSYAYSKDDNSIWDSINNYQYGVAGTGFIGKNEFIGKCIAKHNKGGEWVPVSGFKETLCGYLKLHSQFQEDYDNNPLTFDDDYDMDFYIIPDPAFRHLLLDSKKPGGHYYEPNAICCEVALIESSNDSRTDGATYFQLTKRSDFEYQNIGVYGAFVYDMGHDGYNPEIHPIEQMWHKKEINSTQTEFYLYSMHDNQDRFGRVQYYEPSNCVGLPWIKNPQVNVYYLPFEASFNGNSFVDYQIDLLSGNNINYENATGQTLRLLYHGKELVKVRRPQANFPVVTFFQLGMKDSTTVRGYIAIETSIDKPGLTSGGHEFLKITKTIKAVTIKPLNSNR